MIPIAADLDFMSCAGYSTGWTRFVEALLAKLPHIDSQILSVCKIVPQFSEQKLVGQHLASVLHQYPQEFIFLGR